jgi:hypothetical protein
MISSVGWRFGGHGYRSGWAARFSSWVFLPSWSPAMTGSCSWRSGRMASCMPACWSGRFIAPVKGAGSQSRSGECRKRRLHRTDHPAHDPGVHANLPDAGESALLEEFDGRAVQETALRRERAFQRRPGRDVWYRRRSRVIRQRGCGGASLSYSRLCLMLGSSAGLPYWHQHPPEVPLLRLASSAKASCLDRHVTPGPPLQQGAGQVRPAC